MRTAAAAGSGGAHELRVGLSPGVHYFAERVLARFGGERPAARVRARLDSSGALAREVSAGELEVALGFATAPTAGVERERLADVDAVLAVGAGHRLADATGVQLADLAHETFALVDAHDGAGYNDAVRRLCREAGFDPRTPAAPSGPMAWESAVRDGGSVGLTAAMSATATARDVVVLDVAGAGTFPVDLLTPSCAAADPAPLVAALAATARSLGAAVA